MFKKRSIILFLFILVLSLQAYGQADRDTLYYELKTEMIEDARVDSVNMKVTEYFVFVYLKEKYHAELAERTGNNIGNLLGVTYNGELVSPTLPAIKARIRGGGFSLGDYKQKEEAMNVKNQILN